MNKIFILLVMFLFCPYNARSSELGEFEFNQAHIDNADSILWLTPTFRGVQNEYVLSARLSDEHHEDLKQRFSKMKIATDIDTYTLDSNSKSEGYLIFMKNGAVSCVLKVEAHTTNHKSVRFCRWIINENGFIIIYLMGGLLDGLIADQAYKSLLPVFQIPTEPNQKQLFKVYLASRWSNRFEK